MSDPPDLNRGPGVVHDAAGLLRSAAESLKPSGHAVVALDAAGRVAVWNERAETLLGWGASNAVGRPFFELLIGASRLVWAQGMEVLAAGSRWQHELQMEGPRGRPLRVEVSADPVLSDGYRLGAMMVVTPITPGDLQRRLRELTTLLQVVPDAVVAVDAEGRVREWNPAAELLFGSSRTTMLGSPFSKLVPPDCRPQVARVWEQLSEEMAVPPYETEVVSRGGARQHVSVHIAGVRERTTFLGAIATFRLLSARQEDARLLSEFIAEVPVIVAAYDGDSRVAFAAGGGYLRSGVAPAFALGTQLLTAVPAGTGLHSAIARSLAGHVSQVRVLFDDRVWQCHISPTAGGGFLSAFDVTSEQVVSDRLQALLAAAPLAFVTFDATGRATYAAGSAFTALSADPEDLIGLDLLALYRNHTGIRQALLRCLRGQRVEVVVEYGGRTWDLQYRSYRDGTGSVTGGICIAQDTTHWRTAEPPLSQPGGRPAATGEDRPGSSDEVARSTVDDAASPVPAGASDQVRQRLERDPLTGLPARRGIQRRLNATVPDGHVRTVAVLELNDLDMLRQQHGPQGADVVMQVIAGRLLSGCGQTFLGRSSHGGFALVLDAPTVDPAHQAGELPSVTEGGLDDMLVRLSSTVAAPISLTSGNVHLSCAVALASTEDVPAAALLRHCESTVRKSLDQPRHPNWLPVTGQDRSADALQQVQRLRKALSTEEFVLHYQPVMDLQTREPVGVEALIRWQHPTRGLLSPAAFIPLAERCGLIRDIGQWTLRQACHQANALTTRHTNLVVAVNVSAAELVQSTLVDQVVEILTETRCPAASLTLEITETALSTDLEAAIATLHRLKALGVTLALDDFGTGYGSLLYLRRFPVDLLKLDRSFVAGLGLNDEDTAIVASTISLAHDVGVRCVAEGVETPQQLELLTQLGCDLAQGYLFSRALPAPELHTWLTNQTPQFRGAPPQPSVPSAWQHTAPTEMVPESDQILRMHRDGASPNTIAAFLNLAGHRTPRGTRWRATGIAKVIADSGTPQPRHDTT